MSDMLQNREIKIIGVFITHVSPQIIAPPFYDVHRQTFSSVSTTSCHLFLHPDYWEILCRKLCRKLCRGLYGKLYEKLHGELHEELCSNLSSSFRKKS